MSTRPNRAFQLARRSRALTQAQVAAMVAEVVEKATGWGGVARAAGGLSTV